jgi:hypothetical protein
MSAQHLSDEAVAAFADGVLRGHARDRASRHLAGCAECAQAVRTQREAVLALRAAPAPELPTGLLDRLRALPSTTPASAFTVPAAVAQDGSPLLATFGSLGRAAFVPPGRAGTVQPPTSMPLVAEPEVPSAAPAVAIAAHDQAGGSAGWSHRSRRMAPLLLTAAAVAATGVFAAASSDGPGNGSTQPGLARVVPAGVVDQTPGDSGVGVIAYHRP